MTERAIAISLKIPDNAAYTALAALRRLGLDVNRIERSEIWLFDDAHDAQTIRLRIEKNETIFNPNKHRLVLLEGVNPRPGELWVEEIGARDESREHLGAKAIDGVSNARRYVGWRFVRADGRPESTETLRLAAQRLLCNPAIEHALF